MIRAIYISDNRGETLELKLVDPYETGICVQNIEGLGYPQTSVSSSKLATYDIALFNAQEVDSRNIVLTLGLIGAPSVESSRHLIYDFLPIRYPIMLEIVTDERVGMIRGYVETIEPGIFSSQEAVQVSIICLDPYFYTGGSKYNVQSSSDKANFQFDKWFTDGDKPVEIISDDITLRINSRIQNPKGFQIVVHARSGSFDKMMLKYSGGSIIVNDRSISPYDGYTTLDNYIQEYDDIIIRNDMDDTGIYKRYGKTGNEENILKNSDIITKLDGDFPMLNSGLNVFEISVYGITEQMSNIKYLWNNDPRTQLFDTLDSLYKKISFYIPGDAYKVEMIFGEYMSETEAGITTHTLTSENVKMILTPPDNLDFTLPEIKYNQDKYLGYQYYFTFGEAVIGESSVVGHKPPETPASWSYDYAHPDGTTMSYYQIAFQKLPHVIDSTGKSESFVGNVGDEKITNITIEYDDVENLLNLMSFLAPPNIGSSIRPRWACRVSSYVRKVFDEAIAIDEYMLVNEHISVSLEYDDLYEAM